MSTLIPIYKNKGDVQDCGNYRGIKLMSHTMKLRERVVEARLRNCCSISHEQFCFMPGKSTIDAIFALRMLTEKYIEGQRQLNCVFIDRVPRTELWYCMREFQIPEVYIRVVQNMYRDCLTTVRCAVGTT